MPTPSARLLAVARGDAPADLVIRGARVFSAFTKEWLDADVTVADGRIAGLPARGAALPVGPDTVELDGTGRHLVPGFVDAHVHIESSKLLPAAFARTIVPRGTTTVVVDPHEIAGVLGAEGVRWMLDACDGVPLTVHAMLPSTVPASDLESPRGPLDAEALRELLEHPRVRGVGEMMNAPGVANGDPHALAVLALVADAARVDGHAPGVTGAALDAYLAAGPSTDHEATTLDEALEKRRKGAWVLLREATNARNLRDLLPLVRAHGPEHSAFCTDDREPGTLLHEGHIDGMCAVAVAEGVVPEDALLLATLHGARCHGLDRVGAIAPGWAADLLLLDDLVTFRPSTVVRGGRVVARDGAPVGDAWPAGPAAGSGAPTPSWVRDTVRLAPVDRGTFALPAPSGADLVRVIRAIPDQLLTGEEHVAPTVVDGLVVADPDRDLATIAVLERHHATGRVGLGLVTGFGLRSGAFAGTVSHDAHNVIAVGVDDGDLAACVARLRELGGGLVVCDEGAVVAEMPLPVAGLLSDLPATEVHAQQVRLDEALTARGVTLPSPFMALSFLGLSVIPALKITDRGLVDAAALRPVAFGVEAG
ncbi:adenine deaminase [Patulibacter sp. NPDC049589]|uniref:adenine deaminase n=1 Tax=Patulibacter sp. NPDC049589 TaxID=3154731 RepID=UPI0034125F0D